MLKILAAGYYGFGNLGDELLAETIANIIGTQHKVTILKKRSAFWSEIKKHDCLLFGGGSLFQDVTGRGLSLLYYAGMGFIAKIRGKKLFLVGQGIGPIIRPFNRFIFKLLLKQADFISVRDADSARLLQKLGCKKFILGSDILFWTKFRISTKLSGKIIANLRPFGKFQPEQGVKLLEKFAPVYVPMQNKIDYGKPLSKKQVLQFIAGAKLVVGMRLHFLILAVLFNVPAIGIAYDPKVRAFCRKLKLPCVELDNIAALPQIITKKLTRLNSTKQKLKRTVLQEEQLAMRSLTKLQEALNA